MLGENKKTVLIEVELEDKASSKLKAIGTNIQQTTSQSTPLIGKLATAFKVLIGAIAVKKVVDFGAQVAIAGGNLERMRIATEVLAKNMGISNEQIDDWVTGLQDVNTYGTNAYSVVNAFVRTGLVDLVEGLKRTNKETGKSVTGFDALVLTAKDLGAAMGVSSADAIHAVTSSLVKFNDEGLRQLGIEVNLTKAFQDMAKTLGKETSLELTDVEKRTAILNAVMAEGAKVAGTYEATYGTLGKTLMSIKDNWKTTLETIGAGIQPLLEPFASAFLDVIKNIRTFFEENETEIKEWSENTANTITGWANRVKEIIEAIKTGDMSELGGAWTELWNKIEPMLVALETFWNETLKPIFDLWVEMIIKMLKPAFEELWATIKLLFKEMGIEGERSKEILKIIAQVVGVLIVGAITAVIGLVWVLVKAVTGLIGILTFVYNLANKLWDKFIDDLAKIINLFRDIVYWIGKMVDKVGEIPAVKALGENLGEFFGNRATGGVTGSGWTMVGERGAELVQLPRGSHVYNKEDTQRMSGNQGGSITINVNAPITGVDNLKATILEAVNEATSRQNRLANYNLL